MASHWLSPCVLDWHAAARSPHTFSLLFSLQRRCQHVCLRVEHTALRPSPICPRTVTLSPPAAPYVPSSQAISFTLAHHSLPKLKLPGSPRHRSPAKITQDADYHQEWSIMHVIYILMCTLKYKMLSEAWKMLKKNRNHAHCHRWRARQFDQLVIDSRVHCIT